MPFTPAHPAIVLPLINKKYFSATGLIIGSISPDFEYFFKASVSGVHGHTIAGLFYFDLPVVFFFSLVFHFLIKESLIVNLPGFLQSRLQPVRTLDFKNYLLGNLLLFSLSALLGAVSHIFWDSFTHNGKFFVETLPIYEGAYIPFQGVKYPLWYALQHISTYVGIAIILGYLYFSPSDKDFKVSSPKLTYWIALILLGAVFFVIRFTAFHVKFDLGNSVVTSISSLMLALCLISPIPYFRTVQLPVKP
jgi:hypothetical protein